MTEHLTEIREALRDVRSADDCAEYRLRVHQQWWKDVMVASAGPLPHWLVLVGLEAMEAALVAQEVAA